MKRTLIILLILIISMLLIPVCAQSALPVPQSVMVNNVKINYVEQGEGDEVIVFVHGYAGSLGHWRKVLELLPKEYHAYALDQRGYGQSDKPGSYQLTEMVEDIYAFSQELGIERFTYVGHSMGGKIGMKFALDHPDVLKALVLVCPSAAFALPPDQQLAMKEAVKSILLSPEMMRGAIEQEVGKKLSEEFLNELIEDTKMADPTAMHESMDMIVSTDLMPQLGDIRAPTLVVAGAKDTSSPLDVVVRPTVNAIKGSRLEVFEDSSHFLPEESPQKFVDLLTSFIKDVGVQ